MVLGIFIKKRTKKNKKRTFTREFKITKVKVEKVSTARVGARAMGQTRADARQIDLMSPGVRGVTDEDRRDSDRVSRSTSLIH